MKARRFKVGIVNHIYQRTLNRFNIFYDVADYLVYFTIFCTFSRQTDITVWGLCLMIDHIHALIQADNLKTLSEFISRTTSVFVREYNKSRGRTGSLFEERYGSAPKSDKKHQISCIIYLGNNPVEKSLCMRAEEYRWNFLAYANCPNPFSNKLTIKSSSARLAKSLRIVNHYRKNERYLDHAVLDKIFKGLTMAEKHQLIDYIITKYNCIDYSRLLSHFDSYEQALTAMHSTTGSEYDLKEDRDGFSDATYRDFIHYLQSNGIKNTRNVIMLPTDHKKQLAMQLRRRFGAPAKQICKFLHITEYNESAGRKMARKTREAPK